MNFLRMLFRKPKVRMVIVVYTYWQSGLTGIGNVPYEITGKLTVDLFRAIEAKIAETNKFSKVMISNIIPLDN